MCVFLVTACNFSGTGTVDCKWVKLADQGTDAYVCGAESTVTPETTTNSPTTAPSTSTPTTTPGTPVVDWADEFDGGLGKWDLPPAGCWPGHAGRGLRCPDMISVSDGLLTIRGNADGRTGWMQSKANWKYGKIETRMRVTKAVSGYNPVLLMWPVAENFPVGGEIDYGEIFGRDPGTVNFFLHYGADNSQTHGSKRVDTSQWHVYSFEWTPEYVRGFVDGDQFFEDRNTAHLPPGPMDTAIQLDNFGPAGSSEMQVDYIRYHQL